MKALAKSMLMVTGLVLVPAVMRVSSAAAASVDYAFSTVVSSPVTVGGSAPYLNLLISDTATAGTVQLHLSTAWPTGTPETLTGIWLNIPSVATGVGSLTLSGATGTGQVADSFTAATNPSSFSTSQSLVPAGTTGSVAGFYNIFLKFPNSGSTTSFQGGETETFNLTGTGLTAAAFFAKAAQTAGGLPNPSYYAMASLTNAGGTSGSGIAYLAAKPVPLPAAMPLFLGGLGLLGLRRRRRIQPA